jgi:hypothetical protein
MRRAIRLSVILGLLATTSAIADPNTQILYETTDLGSGRWQFIYDVYNLSLEVEIEEFTIWFGIGSYDNLVIETQDFPASNWDEIVWDPEPFLEDDGGYDAWANLVTPICVGQSISGFAVSFDWLGAGMPGSQYYEIINPSTFETIESGWTVPEPSTLLFFGLSGLALLNKYRK